MELFSSEKFLLFCSASGVTVTVEMEEALGMVRRLSDSGIFDQRFTSLSLLPSA